MNQSFTMVLFMGFIVILLIATIVPQKMRQNQMKRLYSNLKSGDVVRTISGVYGTVVEIHDNHIILELSPGVHTKWVRNSIIAAVDKDSVELNDNENNEILKEDETQVHDKIKEKDEDIQETMTDVKKNN